jgi:N-sulfoglucosamine sulfohydrolase
VSPPNIVYLHSHDTGRCVQPYGYAVPTPRLQRLAEEGTLFRQAFCAASSCSASRACLLTGQYAHSNGMLGLAHRGWSLHDYGAHIVHTLRRRGYRSTLIGEQHIAKDPGVIGYDRVVKIETTHAADVAPAAAAFLGSSPAEPFFLDAGFFETHRAFVQPAQGEGSYIRPPENLPDLPQTRRDMAGFVASARTLDRGLGEVLDALGHRGFSENTLVVCTTDHGIAFPGAKATMTDRGIGVLLILRGPGGFDKPTIVDALVSQIDLYPTICELAGVPTPGFAQGRSLLPLVSGKVARIREEIFAEGTYHAAYEPQRCIRTPRFKYVRRFEPRDLPVLPNTDDSPSKDLWRQTSWPPALLDPEQLYDLVLDPTETVNIAWLAEHREVVAELRERLNCWMRETLDPLLDGPVAPPPGAEYNDPDQESAGDPTRRAP